MNWKFDWIGPIRLKMGVYGDILLFDSSELGIFSLLENVFELGLLVRALLDFLYYC